MNKRLRSDLLLLGGLAAVGLALFALLSLGRDDGVQVLVRVDGVVTQRFSLSEPRSYTIQTRDEGVNELRIDDGAVWLESANCPDCLCVKQGKIRYAGESIICLPHGVVVELSGQDELALDAVTQ